MAKKKRSMLDSARETVVSMLGDFPAGFNAGATAGMLGWPGDMAMMADTARLALTGERSQRPPEEYPLTTDAIAAAAGYPVPKSVSGQLGAAVGGLLSPSPGDLAKFAPLLAIFAGPKAATASQDALSLAKAMDAAGSSQDDIWRATGELGQPWFKGKDGKWRFEIDDTATKFALDEAPIDAYGAKELSALDAVQHPALAEAYPELNDTKMLHWPQEEFKGASFDPNDNTITMGHQAMKDGKSVSLHELQHAIQEREGFARGGSPEMFALGPMFDQKARDLEADLSVYLTGGLGSKPQEIVSALKYGNPSDIAAIAQKHGFDDADAAIEFLMQQDAKRSPFGQYQRLAGEAEARNVQSRMNMSMPERIATPPWMTQDVPDADQIVRYGEGPAMATSEKPTGGLLSSQARLSPKKANAAFDAIERELGPDKTDTLLYRWNDVEVDPYTGKWTVYYGRDGYYGGENLGAQKYSPTKRDLIEWLLSEDPIKSSYDFVDDDEAADLIGRARAAAEKALK